VMLRGILLWVGCRAPERIVHLAPRLSG
jgi:hypothetical protein